MSDEEEENFCYFGKPLDPYDEDAFPKKKPISIEDQIATDAQGRRRFHGAFTGGFSAGFFNTVGSLEGWAPSDFKSSRQEKAINVTQKPEDFMDPEDFEKHGIAPQTVRATKEYSTSKKRRKQVFSDGPIPGIPVLETLLTSGNETIGYLLLKKLSIKEKVKKKHDTDDSSSDTKVYGCQIPAEFKIPEKIENNQYKIPEIYIDSLAKPKPNTFGLDYKGLDRSHVNLFTTSNLVVTDSKNKKFSIAGQAFGVGAFEEEDDDIYMKEDMSNYDFELGKAKQNKTVKPVEGNLHFGIFKPSKAPLIYKKIYPPPTIPHSFTGKHKIKKSRFEPVQVKMEEKEVDRKTINPAIRAKYLGEETVTPTPSQPITIEKRATHQKKTILKAFDASCLMDDRFVSASTTENLEPVKKIETEHGTEDMRNAAKMNMYGALTRITSDWAPCAVLCKRFNVKEPLMEYSEQKRKRTKNLIFENQKHVEDDESKFKPGCSIDIEDVPSTSKDAEEVIELVDVIKKEQLSPTEKKDINLEESNNEVSEGFNQDAASNIAPKDITEKIGIEEKVDLFKAVFLSSSESEDEEEEKQDDTDRNTEEYKETILSELVPKIKPLKEGILSNIKFQSNHEKDSDQNKNESDPEKQILFIPRKERNIVNVDVEPKVQLYGPKLPAQRVLEKKINTVTIIESDDEWIEKDTDEKRIKHKKSKKNKKKHKHSKKK